jgi:hypothetical protein
VPTLHTRAPNVTPVLQTSSAAVGQARRLMLALTSWSIAAALLAFAPRVRAQEAKPALAAQRKESAPRGAVQVIVTTPEDDLLITVAQPGKPLAIVSCYYQCSFWAIPGSYSLWATGSARNIKYETTLLVRSHTKFAVTTGHHAVRTAGLITGILGPIAVGLGYALVAHAVQCGECSEGGNADATAGVALFWGGVAATIVGWTVFATSEQTHVDAIDDEPARPTQRAELRPPLFHAGVQALPHGGWGVGLSAQF